MSIVFDAQAVLGYFQGETGSEALDAVFDGILAGTEAAWINIVNLTEVRYVLLRRAPAQADRLVRWLGEAGVSTVSADETWREAARIKAAYAIGLGDAFALSTALAKQARLVTRDDPDFDVAADLGVKLERIGGARERPRRIRARAP